MCNRYNTAVAVVQGTDNALKDSRIYFFLEKLTMRNGISMFAILCSILCNGVSISICYNSTRIFSLNKVLTGGGFSGEGRGER